MEKEKPKNRLEEIMKYFRGRLRGNHCEGCGRVFDDGDIIFTPDQTSKEHGGARMRMRVFQEGFQSIVNN